MNKLLRERQEEWYRMCGFETNIKCHFYYDESNNCRKFWIREVECGPKREFNVNPHEDFVLAGVVTRPGNEITVSTDELICLLKLQKNVKEIKFKSHFSKGNFLDCMNQKRLGTLLSWIEQSGLLIHCKYVNNLYYTLVEIIDSVTDAIEIEENGFKYFAIKDRFYKMLKGKYLELQELMYQYEYPNLKAEKKEGFVLALLNLFPARYEQTPEEKFITGAIRRAAKSRELPFLDNNEDYVMQQNFLEFYCDGPAKFRDSIHTYDSEAEIQRIMESTKQVIPDNMEFVDSKLNPLVQISDVIAGIWGKLMIYINNTDRIGITRDVEMMNKEQIHNINLLGLLRNKSLAYNKGFLMHVTALSMINREEYLFDLCRRKIR